MNFEHRFIFPDLDKAWNTCINVAFITEAYAQAGADIRWINQQSEGENTRLTCEVTYRNPLPSLAAKILKRDHLTYEINQLIQPAARQINWTLRIRGSGSKARATGQIKFVQRSEGAERQMNANVTIDVPLIGRKIEKEAIKKLQQGQDDLCKLILNRSQAL